MTCQELVSHIDAFLDNELSVGETLRVQIHLVLCDSCRRIVASEVRLRNLIEVDALQDAAPGELRERILQQIGEQPASGIRRTLRPSPSRLRVFSIGLVVGGAAFAIIFVVATSLFKGPPQDISPLAAEVVGKHRIYSQAEEMLQVATSESSELALWLSGRLRFPMKLPLLARPGERLLGGRISSVGDGQAAYLLYERDGRRISLFIFRALPDLPPAEPAKRVGDGRFYTSTLQGRAVVWWEDSEVYYAATGDGELEDLIEFALLCVKGRTVSVSEARGSS